MILYTVEEITTAQRYLRNCIDNLKDIYLTNDSYFVSFTVTVLSAVTYCDEKRQ